MLSNGKINSILSNKTYKNDNLKKERKNLNATCIHTYTRLIFIGKIKIMLQSFLWFGRKFSGQITNCNGNQLKNVRLINTISFLCVIILNLPWLYTLNLDFERQKFFLKKNLVSIVIISYLN